MSKLKTAKSIIPVEDRKCDGRCGVHGECQGDIIRVHVADERPRHKRDWGYYHYCEVAIATDTENGLTVAAVED